MPNLAPKVKLNNGQEMPAIGLGTWRSFESDAERAVADAIDVGYRHIDTAYVYENEHEVGAAIKAKIAAGIIKREDIFIVTKLGGIHHAPEHVEAACRKSLSNLGLEYIDQYLIHHPVGVVYSDDIRSNNFSDVDYVQTWQAMEKLVDLKLVRGIGLSNFNAEQIERVLSVCRIKPVVNQVECHPCLNQKKLIAFAKAHDIIITAYCPLGRPKVDQQLPPFIFDETAKSLAQKYQKSTAQIALRYLIQLGTVPIPKSVSKQRIAENFNVFDFVLSDEDMQVIDKYHTGERLVPFVAMKQHKYYSFNTEF